MIQHGFGHSRTLGDVFGPEPKTYLQDVTEDSRTLGDVFGPERLERLAVALAYSRTLGDVFGPEPRNGRGE